MPIVRKILCVCCCLTLLSLIKTQGAELLKPYCRFGEHGPHLSTSTEHTLPFLGGMVLLQTCWFVPPFANDDLLMYSIQVNKETRLDYT